MTESHQPEQVCVTVSGTSHQGERGLGAVTAKGDLSEDPGEASARDSGNTISFNLDHFPERPNFVSIPLCKWKILAEITQMYDQWKAIARLCTGPSPKPCSSLC